MLYKHILVAVELSDDSKVLINKAVALAKVLEADVSLIHIDGTIGEVSKELVDIQGNPHLRPLNEHSNLLLRAMQKETAYPIEHFLVGTGFLAEKLANVIPDKGFDLLVCGHHHDFWSNMVSYSKKLINKSPIDILVVPI